MAEGGSRSRLNAVVSGSSPSVGEVAASPSQSSATGADALTGSMRTVTRSSRRDWRGVAEMSCIAGVGGGVPHLLKIALSGRPIVALDGCPLVCVKSSLSRHGIQARNHYQLHQFGVKKRAHQDFDLQEAARVVERVSADLARQHAAVVVSSPCT